MTTEQMDAIDDAKRLETLDDVMDNLVRESVLLTFKEIMDDLPDSMQRAVVERMVVDAMARVLKRLRGA